MIFTKDRSIFFSQNIEYFICIESIPLHDTNSSKYKIFKTIRKFVSFCYGFKKYLWLYLSFIEA